jgi:cardiolipin synthase (CMP-forming)
MHRRSYYIVNAITLYRMMNVPVLIFLIVTNKPDLFKWFLFFSFLSDAIDGWLARRHKVTSFFGSKLDSIADDLTIAAAITGVIVLKIDFLKQEIHIFIVLAALYVLQTILALIRYRKISSFHTYAAKMAAILQGIFLLLLFFLAQPVYILFYIAVVVTIIDLAEEIVLVLLLPHWQTNVKGLYWVIRQRQSKQ